ncbi:MAG: hypothetical protein EBQ84_05785 [Betaproteobacteria bacterium]|nr:hypothetical protein [Betaproteobacteria bacterium]
MNMPNDQAKIGRTREESTPFFPERKNAKKGSPNIVIIYMDDMGWSDPGCYGSEIDTPNIKRLHNAVCDLLITQRIPFVHLRALHYSQVAMLTQ